MISWAWLFWLVIDLNFAFSLYLAYTYCHGITSKDPFQTHPPTHNVKLTLCVVTWVWTVPLIDQASYAKRTFRFRAYFYIPTFGKNFIVKPLCFYPHPYHPPLYILGAASIRGRLLLEEIKHKILRRKACHAECLISLQYYIEISNQIIIFCLV